MGLGNGRHNSGNKGSNFNYEFRSIAILGEISNILSGAVPAPPGGLASEATLQAVLTAVDTMRDYEVRLVVDSDAPPVTWMEVRYWDAQTGALGTPQYYLPGSTVPGTPTGSISYINQQTLLNQILAELQLQTAELVSIDGKDFATETTLAALNAKLNTLGQKVSGESVPVVLSTEQEAMIDGLEGLLTTIDAVLDAIKIDTGNIALDTAAMVVDLAAIEALLITIDNVLDAIKLDTANLDVALSTRATEATLAAIDTKLTSVTRTPSYTRVTGASTSSVAAGARSATFANFGNTNATVLGSTLAPGASISFSAGGEEDVLGAIAYSTLAGNTELLITTIV